ncbi:MAG TPA: fused MFS/spermidine synthase, partial [Verrucomicrobiales bacterium]|nr:fused MFS/spermidine synthase [Verrucomicrobiales bacterium]
YLTSFYFCLSLGGFLGGAFTSLLAPRLFNGTLEYHLMLIAAAALIVTVSDDRQPASQKQRRPWGLPGFVAMIAIVIWSALGQYVENPVLRLLGAAVPAAACLLLARRPAGFAIGVGAILLSSYFFPPGDAAMLHVERSYFGIHRVFQRPYGYRWLIHGSTLHGVQNMEPDRRRVPMGYYHPDGPLGSVFGTFGKTLTGPVAIAGLGTGAIAAYGKPQQEMTFFEIDPAVERIAKNPDYFTYLSDSAARVNVVLGDARLSLKAAPDAHYQMIILDAYSSDAIPVHLLTREAIQLYLSKLQPGGLLVFHLSNLHFDLRPLATALCRDASLDSLFAEDPEPEEKTTTGERIPSRWFVAAREVLTLAPLEKSGNWIRETAQPTVRVWTDDYSSPVELLNWRSGQ